MEPLVPPAPVDRLGQPTAPTEHRPYRLGDSAVLHDAHEGLRRSACRAVSRPFSRTGHATSTPTPRRRLRRTVPMGSSSPVTRGCCVGVAHRVRSATSGGGSPRTHVARGCRCRLIEGVGPQRDVADLTLGVGDGDRPYRVSALAESAARVCSARGHVRGRCSRRVRRVWSPCRSCSSTAPPVRERSTRRNRGVSPATATQTGMCTPSSTTRRS